MSLDPGGLVAEAPYVLPCDLKAPMRKEPR